MLARWPSELFKVDTPTPAFTMSPFDARFLNQVRDAANDSAAEGDPDWRALFQDVPGRQRWALNGRSALGMALAEIAPAPDDEIVIVTTSGSPYISGCVTREIEKVCRWSRERSARTRAALVIHEFGFPATLPATLGPDIPIIEDCVWTLGTSAHDMGRIGDFAVFSLSKALPLPFGGILRSREPLTKAGREYDLSPDALKILRGSVARHLPRLAEAVQIRRDNHQFFADQLGCFGFQPYFELKPGIAPHAFVFKLEDEVRGKRAKEILRASNVESSVFFGAGGYYLPNHQNMDFASVSYLCQRFMEAWNRAA